MAPPAMETADVEADLQRISERAGKRKDHMAIKSLVDNILKRLAPVHHRVRSLQLNPRFLDTFGCALHSPPAVHVFDMLAVLQKTLTA